MARHAKSRTAALIHGRRYAGARKTRKASNLQRPKAGRKCQSSSSTWLLLASVAGTTLWVTHPAYGQDALYWGGSGTPAGSGSSPSGTWAAGSLNWSSDPTGAGNGAFSDVTTITNDLIFGTADATGSYIVTVGDTEGADNITFATGTVTLGGTGTINIATGADITNTSGNPVTFGTTVSQTGGENFSITGNGTIGFQTITGNNAYTVTVGTLNDGSTGTVTFGGTSDNSFMDLTVNSGTVVLAKVSNGGTHAASSLTINGGTVQIDGNSAGVDQQIYGGSSVTINGGTFDLNGRNEGIPQLNGASAGTITNTANSPATLTLGENDGGQYNGQIIDGMGGIAVTHIGTGTSVLNGVNTFTQGLTILSGAIRFGLYNSLGNGNITLGDGTNTGLSATLIADGGINNAQFAADITNPIFATGNGTNEITTIGFSPMFSGPITLNNSDLILNSNNGGSSTLTATGGVTGNGSLILQVMTANTNSAVQLNGSNAINNNGNITNNGTGTGTATINANIGSNVNNVIQDAANSQLTLTGSNTFGGLTILAGTVNLGVSNGGTNGASGSGNITIGDAANTGLAATLSTQQGTTYSNAIMVTGNGTDTIFAPNFQNTFSGNVTLQNNSSLFITTNGSNGNSWSNINMSGAISGNGSLILANLNAGGGGDGNAGTTLSNSVNNSGTITHTGDNTGTDTISGNIGSNVTGVIQNSATSALTLSGNNIYSSPTIVSAGTLIAGIASVANVSGAFGNNSALVLGSDPSAAVNLNGFNTQVGSITGGGTTGGNVSLGGATLTTGGDGTSPAPYAGTISGSGGVTKIGGGTQIFSSTNSSYTGSTTISGGTLDIQNATSLFNTANDNTLAETISIAGGSILELDETSASGEWALGDAGGITITGSGTLQLNETGSGTNAGLIALGDQGFSLTINMNMSGGTIDIEGGILRNGGYGSAIWTSNYASMNIAAGATLDLWDGNAVMVDGLTGNGTVTHTAQGGSTNLTVGVDNDINGPATFAGSFVETNGHTISLTKVGTGVQVLTGVNGYTAGTTVDGGTLIFVNNQSGSANYTDNATLEFDVTIGTQQLNGGTISGNGRLNINGGGTVLFGAENSPENISLSAGGLIDVSGSGTLLRNEYSNGNWAQNYASLEVDSGATVNLWDSPGGITVDALNGSGTVTHTSYGGTENLTVGIAGGSGTFSGIISDTPGYSLSLIKTGAGTQTLTNSGNTYVGGTTINAGTLAAVGEALSTGNVTLAGGTLAVNDGVTANAQTLTTGNQMWKASSAYTARVFNDGSADLLSLTAAGSGTLTIDSSVTSDTPFTVHVTGATGSLSATTSQDWVIANGITTLTGVTNPTPGNPTVVATAGAHASASGFVLDMPSDLFTGNNNGFATTPVLEFEDTGGLYSLDVVYTDAPEPGTAVLVLGALVPSILGRRRRKNERGLL